MANPAVLFPSYPIPFSSYPSTSLKESKDLKETKVDYSKFSVGFSHLLVIFITAALVFVVSWKWSEALTALFNKMLCHEMCNWVSVKIFIAFMITIISVLIIYGLHWVMGMVDHLEDHMS